jgi:hypothetical protein
MLVGIDTTKGQVGGAITYTTPPAASGAAPQQHVATGVIAPATGLTFTDTNISTGTKTVVQTTPVVATNPTTGRTVDAQLRLVKTVYNRGGLPVGMPVIIPVATSVPGTPSYFDPAKAVPAPSGGGGGGGVSGSSDDEIAQLMAAEAAARRRNLYIVGGAAAAVVVGLLLFRRES